MHMMSCEKHTRLDSLVEDSFMNNKDFGYADINVSFILAFTY